MFAFRIRRAPARVAVRQFPIAVAILSLIVGCSSEAHGPRRVPLAGIVTLNGDPLEGAEINFFNEQDQVGMITGPGGVYSIPTGAAPGDYKVTVSKREGIENVPEGVAVDYASKQYSELLPPHFSSPTLTKMTFKVPDEGTDAADFHLKTR